MKKSEMIKLIQQVPGVVTVEPIHISPDEPDELLCLITFLPVEQPKSDIEELISFLKWMFIKSDKGDTPEESMRMLKIWRERIESMSNL